MILFRTQLERTREYEGVGVGLCLVVCVCVCVREREKTESTVDLLAAKNVSNPFVRFSVLLSCSFAGLLDIQN